VNTRLWLAVAVCVGVSLTPWGPVVLYPFTLFTTWVHETGHAVATLLLGGRVSSMSIQPDTSGVTRSLMPASRLAQAIVASAGYLGAIIVGCALLAATRVERRAKPILWGIGAFMLVTLLLWIRNPFGAFVVLVWGVTLMVIARRRTGQFAGFVLNVLAILVTLNAVFDLRALFFARGHSDAETMARLLGPPAWIWAGMWLAMSVAMLVWTLRATRGR
jgi:hypothetical protein